MKQKHKEQLIRSIVIISIIVGAVLIASVYQIISRNVSYKSYRTEYSEYVEKYSYEYGVPEYIVYATIKYESGFVNGIRTEEGRIGLMGLTVDEFETMLKMTKELITNDALYGPETNIKYGTYRLSLLYNQFGDWHTALAAKDTDDAVSSAWTYKTVMTNGEEKKEYDIDDVSSGKADEILKIADKYIQLYYTDRKD